MSDVYVEEKPLREPTFVSLEAVNNYVNELLVYGRRARQSSVSRGRNNQAFTVEYLLEKVYGRFFNQKGQSPFPDGLPFSIRQIPHLAKVAQRQVRITAMVQSAVATRPVVTIYELELEVCSNENISTYAELGLGDSLAMLPFVQHAFKLPSSGTEIAPVTSNDFLQFLLFDAYAKIVLTSGGDAGDAVRAFARSYKGDRYNPAQLGIHIQHFSWLLQFLRQEIARTSALLSQAVTENSCGVGRRLPFYEKVVESLHGAMTLHDEEIRRSKKFALPFSVHASPAEVESVGMSPLLWGAASEAPVGGLLLHGVLQADPVITLSSSATVAATGVNPGIVPSPHVAFDSSASGTPAASREEAGSNVHRTSLHGVGSSVSCAYSKRRKRVVVDGVTEVVGPPRPVTAEMAAPPLPTLPTALAVTSPTTAFPSLPLADAISIIRCLGFMQAAVNFPCVAGTADFATFRSYASQLCPLLQQSAGASVSQSKPSGADIVKDGKMHMGLISTNILQVSMETVLSVLSSTGPLSKLYELYCFCVRGESCSKDGRGTQVGDAKVDEDSTPSSLMAQCITLGLQELLFVPIVGVSSPLPLALVNSSNLSGRVVLARHHSYASLFQFHPLHLMFDPPTCGGHVNSSCDSEGDGCICDDNRSTNVLFVDSYRLFSTNGSFSGDYSPEKREAEREHRDVICDVLQRYGVLLSVPDEWFHNGFLLKIVNRLLKQFHGKSLKSENEECYMALRMLTLYWWLVGLWFSIPDCNVTKSIKEFVRCLGDTRWIPSFSVYNGDNKETSTLRVTRWHTTYELFPFTECFTSNGLPRLLNFAPHDCMDLIIYWEHYVNMCNRAPAAGKEACDLQSALLFVRGWVPAVKQRISKSPLVRAERIAQLLGLPLAWSAEIGLQVVRSLRVGMCIPLEAMQYVMRCIASDSGSTRDGVLLALKQEASIPLPAPYVGVDDGGTFIVSEIARCNTLHWLPLTSLKNGLSKGCESQEDGQNDDLMMFNRCICFFGDQLRDFFLQSLSVSPVPTVSSWIAAAEFCRAQTPAGPLVNQNLTDVFLRALSLCCVAQHSYLVDSYEKATSIHDRDEGSQLSGDSLHHGSFQAALNQLLKSIPAGSEKAYVFPLGGRWRRAAEGLFFCGSYYCGLDGFALQTTYGGSANLRKSSTPQLPVLVFTEQRPHHIVAAVLEKMNLKALEDCTEKTVTFGDASLESSSELHRRIGVCVPRVQEFLRRVHPQYYELVRDNVQQRLENFSCVLANDPCLKEVLRFQGYVYSMVRSVRCTYVQQHNSIYGVDEQFTPCVGAGAVAEIFMPLEDPEIRNSLQIALRECFQWEGPRLDVDEYSLMDSPDAEKSIEQRHGTQLTHEMPWQLSSAPVLRFREHFPLGREGFSLSGRAPSSVPMKGALGGLQGTQLKLSLGVNGNEFSIKSLPEWQGSFFDIPRDIVKTLKQNSHSVSNTERSVDGSCNTSDESESGDYDGESNRNGAPAVHGVNGRKQRKRTRQSNGPRAVLRPGSLAQRGDTHDYSVAAERFAYEKLCREVPKDVEVLWVNEHVELGAPYDILLVRRNAKRRGGTFNPTLSGRGGDIVAFIEVKSTCTKARRDFEMSLREILFAARFGIAYKVHRVFCASTSAMREMHVEVLEDIVTMWHHGRLTLTGEVKVMPTAGG
uniref:WGS project CAEQ00000000 data, annotated contig 1222 n=1 Tax=Trypanosoma congolense (strain IL3000) TaxID=1068625 RepID=F9W4S7_TRYCI|nr:unnamed protein product [Trypanosoma congolense IL3000]